MKFDPSLPRDGINVGRTHPLRELALLLTGFLAVAMLLVIVVGAAIDFVVPRLPPGLESRIFGPVWVTSEVRDHAVSEAEDDPHLDCARELLERLARRWPDAPYRFHVGLWHEEQSNALALPGGFLMLTSGLLDSAGSENELAFVLGHELGHFHNRDHMRGLGRGLVLRLALAALGAGAAGDLAEAATSLGARRFDREQELAADRFGLELVAEEYGHVGGASDFFAGQSAGNEIGRRLEAYASTHPVGAERLEALRALARERGWDWDGELRPLASGRCPAGS